MNDTRWAEVLDAAAHLFAEKGYAATTVQDIASRAGLVNKGSLYYYINTKDDLLWQLALRAHTDALDRLREAEPSFGVDAASRLAAFIAWWTRYSVEARPVLAWIERDMRSLDASQQASLAKLRRRFRAFIVKILRDGIDDGSFDPALDVDIALGGLIALVQGTGEWYHGQKPFDDVIAFYQRIIIRGIERSTPPTM